MTALSYLSHSPRVRQWAPDDELTRKQASLYLTSIGCPLSVRAMEKRASNNNAGKGPAFIRKSWKCVRYLRKDLDAWAAAQAERIK